MIRSELIEQVANDNPHLTRADAERVVGTIFDEIIRAMETGGRVELRGFGAFSVRDREGRKGRNPRTGAPVDVDAKAVPYFKAGKEIKQRLQVAAIEAGAIPDSKDS